MYYPASSLNDDKIFNFIIYNIKDGKVRDGYFTTSFKEINDFLNLSLNYKQMKKNFINLMSITIELGVLNKQKNKKKWTLIHLVDKVYYDNGILKIFLPDELVQMVLHDKDSYCRLNFRLINEFKSKYTIRLYENIMRYMSRKNTYLHMPKMEMETFKKLMGIEKDKYKRFIHLKTKVINVAVDEINNNPRADLSITKIEYFKEATKYTHIKFYTEYKYKTQKDRSSIPLTALFYDDKDLLTFIDNYLPKYADKKIIGYIDGYPLYFYKYKKRIILKNKVGEIKLNLDTWMETLRQCYYAKETFDWYDDKIFQNILHKEEEKETAEKFKG